MSAEEGALPAEEQGALLERLVVDNEDLERLEGMVGRFNLFEALGVVAQEVRHSDFLAFLLDPRGTHGLGDLFAKRFLQAALAAARKAGRPAPILPVDLDVMDLGGAEVARERHRIDVLLTDERNGLVVAVENKIWSGEGEGQLGRYWRAVEEGYPGWRRILLYLTPRGEEASRPEYLPVGYGAVRDAAQVVLASRGDGMDPALGQALRHYCEVLGRHVIGDSEIAELCKKIYRKHRRALDLIYEHRPDRQDGTNLIKKCPAHGGNVNGGKKLLRLRWGNPGRVTGSTPALAFRAHP